MSIDITNEQWDTHVASFDQPALFFQNFCLVALATAVSIGVGFSTDIALAESGVKNPAGIAAIVGAVTFGVGVIAIIKR